MYIDASLYLFYATLYRSCNYLYHMFLVLVYIEKFSYCYNVPRQVIILVSVVLQM